MGKSPFLHLLFAICSLHGFADIAGAPKPQSFFGRPPVKQDCFFLFLFVSETGFNKADLAVAFFAMAPRGRRQKLV